MILQRYILTSLVRPFLIGFGFITFLLTMEMLLDLLDLLLGRGVDVLTVGQLFLLALGWMVALSIPCGVLVAVLMTYGRMSQDNEITALRASGVHIFRIVAPALGTSVILAAALAAFNNYVLPETNYHYARLMRQISRKNPTVQIREGVINDAFKGYSIRINQLDDRSGAMEDIVILDSSTDPKAPRTIVARSGFLTFRPEQGLLTLDLRDGTIHEADPGSESGAYRIVAFDQQKLQIHESGDAWADSPAHRRSDREMSIARMEEEIGKLEGDRAREEERMREALAALGMGSVAELARWEPEMFPPRPRERFLAALAFWNRGPEVQPTREWTREEENALGVVRARHREAEALEKKIKKYEVEIHKKFSIPIACVVFVLVGAPLGMLARRGGMAVGLFSAVFFIFYYLCLIGGEQLADRLLVPTWLAMWFPNLLLGGVGATLMHKAIRSGQVTKPRIRAGSA